VNNQINQDLKKLGVTQHNEHLGWDYSNAPKTPTTPGGRSKYLVNLGIDKKILNGHGEAASRLTQPA
jgi:hypothetical protein